MLFVSSLTHSALLSSALLSIPLSLGSGEFLFFGSACAPSSSLPHIQPEVRYNNAFIAAREANKLILPPHQPGAGESSIAVRKLCSQSLVLLEDGQVHDLDSFNAYEPWVAGAFTALNAMRLPLIDLVVGGALIREGATKLSTAAQGASGEFFICLTSTGEVWVFGLNSSGQLGLGHTRSIDTPTRVDKFAPAAQPNGNIAAASQTPLPSKIVSIAAGRSHSLVLTSEGSVYAFGRNVEGQLGLAQTGRLRTIEQLLETVTGPERAKLEDEKAAEEAKLKRSFAIQQLSSAVTPRFIHHFTGTRITHIAACNHLSAAIDADGRVWHWGYGLMQQQATVPSLISFSRDVASPPRILSVALGHSHALLLDDAGQAYAVGSTLSGALGLGRALPKRIEAATRVVIEGESNNLTKKKSTVTTIVAVFAGSFYSVFLDSRGRVHVCGRNDGGKLGVVVGVDGDDLVYTPTLLRDVGEKMVSTLYPGRNRLILFVPTRLTTVEPGVIGLQGGTKLIIRGAGFFVRDTIDPTVSDGDGIVSSQIQVSFTYLGRTLVSSGVYDGLNDVIRVTSPEFEDRLKGGVYKNHHLEDGILRVSMDRGRHWSNALALHAFHTPQLQQRDALAASGTISMTPAHGPITGGSIVTIVGPFDIIPYQHILVRVATLTDDENDGEGSESPFATVAGKFDPIGRAIIVAMPPLPKERLTPSIRRKNATNANGTIVSPSRFKRLSPASPPTSLLPVRVSISLDGQNFFRFPLEFSYTSVTCHESLPSSLPLSGGYLRLKVTGVTSTSNLRVRFTTTGGSDSQDVEGRFLSLSDARTQARQERERQARQERKRRQDALEAERQAAIALAAYEEEHRDPKEKERLLREREKAEAQREKDLAKQREKEQAQAKKDGLASERLTGRSRPTSSGGSAVASIDSPASPTRPRSSLSNKSRAQTPSSKERPTSAVSFAIEGAEQPQHAIPASIPSIIGEEQQQPQPHQSSQSPPEPDEFDLLESSFVSSESKEDESLNLLNTRDRAGVGYIVCTTPSFRKIGPCQPIVAISTNGGRDYQTTECVLAIVEPTPTLTVRPNCGPVAGGTRVRIDGQHFYHTRNIQVQIRHAKEEVQSRPITANDANNIASPKVRATSAKRPTATSIGGGSLTSANASHRSQKDGPDVPIVPVVPPPPPQPQTVPASYEVDGASADASLSFTTPSEWTTPCLTRLHVGFDIDQNAYSRVGAPFRFYETPIVLDAHPILISQSGGTEVTLIGRGFVDCPDVRVRLVLQDEEVKGGHKAAPASAAQSVHDGDATPHTAAGGASSTRRRLQAASSHASLIDDAAASDARRQAQPKVERAAIYHANDPADEIDDKKKKTTSGGVGGGKKKDGELEPELPTITFTTPIATEFNQVRQTQRDRKKSGEDGCVCVGVDVCFVYLCSPTLLLFVSLLFAHLSPLSPLQDFSDGSAVNRILGLELALNGQQFVTTGIQLRFEKDSKKNNAVKKK